MSDVSLFILAVLDRRLRKDGRSIDALLGGTSVRPDAIHRVRPSRCSWDDFATVMEALADELGGLDELASWSATLSSETPGLLTMLAKRYVKPQTLHYVGASWYGPSMIRGTHAEIEATDDGLIQTIHLPDHFRPCSAVAHFLAGILSATATLVGWAPSRVAFVEAPRTWTFHIHLLPPDPAGLDAESVERERIAVAQDLVELQALQPDAGQTSAEQVASVEVGSIASRVRVLLETAADGPALTPPEAAHRLGMSDRTLARGLASDGVTFRALRDERRRDLAIQRLEAGDRIDEIARALDFSDASAFHRAFRRWTGRSPGSYQADRSTP